MKLNQLAWRKQLDGNWLNFTWIHALIFIFISYLMNVIYFFGLINDGRGKFATNSFITLLASSSARFIWLLIFSLVAVGLGRLLQMYQNLLAGTNKLMWYYSSFLKTNKPEDEFWAEHRQLLIQKWNDWILLAWLLTIRVISSPLRLRFPSLQAIKTKGLMTDVEYQSIIAQRKTSRLKIFPCLCLNGLFFKMKSQRVTTQPPTSTKPY